MADINEDTFWKIIDDCFSDDTEDQLGEYEARLEEMSREQVLEFQRTLNAVMARAYRSDLIGAACFLGCGQSDDGFEDFRAWLVSHGHETFESFLADHNLIAALPYDDSPTEEWHCEELHMTPGEIGGEEEDEDWPYPKTPDSPVGEPVEITIAALQQRFPKFWERFGSEFMIGIS